MEYTITLNSYLIEILTMSPSNTDCTAGAYKFNYILIKNNV